jgi:uncharacterized protein YjbJ (UPF0337 family)
MDSREPTCLPSVSGGMRSRTIDSESRYVMADMDEIKHKGEELIGKGKEGLGDATDNNSLKAEGKADQGEAGVKQFGDKVKDVFTNDEKH